MNILALPEDQQRAAVVAEAISWERTPYHHMGRVKSVGTDCGMFLAEVFARTELIPTLKIDYYPMDWHLHRSEERYLGWVRKYATEVHDRDPLPGDIILYQFGRCISHGSLVISWPTVIHAYIHQGVVKADGTKEPLASRQRAIYSIWG